MIPGIFLAAAFSLYAAYRSHQDDLSAEPVEQMRALDNLLPQNNSIAGAADFEMVQSRPGYFDQEHIAFDFNYSSQGDYLGYTVRDYDISGLNTGRSDYANGIIREDVRYGHATIGRYIYDPRARQIHFNSDNPDISATRLNDREIRITIDNADRHHSARDLDSGGLHGGAEYNATANSISFTLDEGDIFGRDWRSGVVHDIDPRLFKLAERTLQILQDNYGVEAELMDLVSLYRTQETIARLEGASRSQHQFGRALDMGPTGLGVSYAHFHAAAMQAMQELNTELGLDGGVGTYNARNQIHIDTRGTGECGIADWGLYDRLPRPTCLAA